MSDMNKIFDDKYRENFLRSADPLSLNNYLKNMERLSRKGGKYFEIYNKDMIYLLDLNDTIFQDGGNLGSLFIHSNLSESQSQNNLLTEQPHDTEVYIDRINNITKKTFSSEFESIKEILMSKSNYDDKKKAIIKFIDEITNPISIKEFNVHIVNDLSNIIAKNTVYMKDAFTYLTKLLQNNKNMISEEFMKEYSNLRSKKNMSEYQLLKEKLINDYIKQIGIRKVYVSKFVEKIINEYKKLKS
ncbi:hypothetical protein Indivirus_3_42 [Indivirus ILV1]|uniref:Uncharacterized protein n=1 Tax=Indivirus ILV1 TaxID=1977633 RepID=A0A1V0SDJ6_9VIRU|nr:hypothetical protein Indivirus_3_42 [Indivirus ILV1]